MTHWTEKTWMMGVVQDKVMALMATYKKYPNRPVQTVVLGLPELAAGDALVVDQIKKMMGGMH